MPLPREDDNSILPSRGLFRTVKPVLTRQLYVLAEASQTRASTPNMILPFVDKCPKVVMSRRLLAPVIG